MDKASAYGAGDCRFEFCRGHYASEMLTPLQRALHFSPCANGKPPRDCQHGRYSSRHTPKPRELLLEVCSGHPQASAHLQKPPTGIEPVTIRLRSACSAN